MNLDLEKNKIRFIKYIFGHKISFDFKNWF